MKWPVDSVVIDNKAWTPNKIEELYCAGALWPLEPTLPIESFWPLNEITNESVATDDVSGRNGTKEFVTQGPALYPAETASSSFDGTSTKIE